MFAVHRSMFAGRSSGLRKSLRRFSIEPLEPRMLLAGDPVIAEFMAKNDATLQDEDGDWSDWIEIRNNGDAAVDLESWYLTDDAAELNRWNFPDVALAPGEQLIVFASGKDRTIPGAELHADFKLDGDGEYLALVGPDDATVRQEFSPAYPPQVADVSYGPDMTETPLALVEPGDAVDVLVPDASTGPALGTDWTAADYVPGANGETWSAGQSGVGFDTQGDYDTFIGPGGDVEAAMLGRNASAYVRTEFNVADLASIGRLDLNMQYDDGFVAYLNGREVAHRNAAVAPSEFVYDYSTVPNASGFPGIALGGQDHWVALTSGTTARNDLDFAPGMSGNNAYHSGGDSQSSRLNDANFSYDVVGDFLTLEYVGRINGNARTALGLGTDANGNGRIDGEGAITDEVGFHFGIQGNKWYIRQADFGDYIYSQPLGTATPGGWCSKPIWPPTAATVRAACSCSSWAT